MLDHLAISQSVGEKKYGVTNCSLDRMATLQLTFFLIMAPTDRRHSELCPVENVAHHELQWMQTLKKTART